jgi:error-prone DNA polymerase
LRHWRARLDQRGVLEAAELEHAVQGRRVGVAGLVLSRQQPGTASGIVFVTLEDETGICNVVLYRRVFERFYLAARHAKLLLVEGKIERQVTHAPPNARAGEPDRPIPIVHLIAEKLTRLDSPEDRLRSISRDFH